VIRKTKISRCGFVVIKLQIAGEDYFLMRENKRWHDINFIGGHEKPRDKGSLSKAARRELLEEVPLLRKQRAFRLEAITDEVDYGPVFSKSAGREVQYELQVFLVKFLCTPDSLLQGLGPRSANVLIRASEVLDRASHRISGLVALVDRSLKRGLRSIPMSWPEDVAWAVPSRGQLDLPLKWASQSDERAGQCRNQD
jgi:hypothetical protein